MKLCRFDDDRLGRVQADNVLDVTPALAQISVQRRPIAQGDPLALHLERPRHLALWAGAVALLVVPVAALYGPLVARYLAIASPGR